MTKEQIIKEISKKFDIDTNHLIDTARFKEDLNLDSIDLIETLMDIEEENNIQIPDDKAKEIKTIGEFIKVTMEATNE